ncbi:5'-methylthioadenosine/adenosylhomocysteine nucleosidase [Piscinibacter sakaiensis]|uniref:5'-methylthioadenosine nucleosidase/S-adenosylhomocysteine nucleosidase n=1 Tax=Piscinibacter sakaiensis TaxID=1547922 RepID=A0A0K8NVS8_PISS1|nr:5'-methylthioadenosine/adenosylhomocysteine nucleosidase [Piscinibacter sakaiensis]GAP34496.1 5'-methylthioadenosine nucleosidase/S-adenosylhomocysteine nucleosidase [Piscinibacter sakaiensis]
MTDARPTAIVAAIDEELRGLAAGLDAPQRQRRAGRDFLLGTLEGRPVVLVLSHIGKVAAATTTALLLGEFGCGRVVFTGVAGGLGDGVHVGDVVVAQQLLQHDLDASPLFPRWEVPHSGRDRFDTDASLTEALAAAATRALAALPPPAAPWPLPAGAARRPPRVHRGLVVSGDRFVHGPDQGRALRAALPAALAVEMEGAALAQVCHDFGVPFAVVRTVSDRADGSAAVDFARFIRETASVCSEAIIRGLLRA